MTFTREAPTGGKWQTKERRESKTEINKKSEYLHKTGSDVLLAASTKISKTLYFRKQCNSVHKSPWRCGVVFIYLFFVVVFVASQAMVGPETIQRAEWELGQMYEHNSLNFNKQKSERIKEKF